MKNLISNLKPPNMNRATKGPINQHKQAINSREYVSTEATARVGITIQESEKAEAFPFGVELIYY